MHCAIIPAGVHARAPCRTCKSECPGSLARDARAPTIEVPLDSAQAPSTRPPQEVSRAVLQKALQESVARNFGDAGAGNLFSSMTVKYWHPIASIFIARVSRDWHTTFWSAITFLRQVKDTELVCRVLNVSNLSRSCSRAALALVRQRVEQVRRQLRMHGNQRL